jgi:hydrogenase maturation factor
VLLQFVAVCHNPSASGTHVTVPADAHRPLIKTNSAQAQVIYRNITFMRTPPESVAHHGIAKVSKRKINTHALGVPERRILPDSAFLVEHFSMLFDATIAVAHNRACPRCACTACSGGNLISPG